MFHLQERNWHNQKYQLIVFNDVIKKPPYHVLYPIKQYEMRAFIVLMCYYKINTRGRKRVP